MAGLDSNCSRFPPLSCSCYRTEVHPVLITRPSLSPTTRGGLPPVPQLARERERAKAPSCNDMSLTLIEFEDIRVPSARPSRPFGPCSLNNFKRQVKRKGGGQKGEKKAKTLFFFSFSLSTFVLLDWIVPCPPARPMEMPHRTGQRGKENPKTIESSPGPHFSSYVFYHVCPGAPSLCPSARPWSRHNSKFVPALFVVQFGGLHPSVHARRAV